MIRGLTVYRPGGRLEHVALKAEYRVGTGPVHLLHVTDVAEFHIRAETVDDALHMLKAILAESRAPAPPKGPALADLAPRYS